MEPTPVTASGSSDSFMDQPFSPGHNFTDMETRITGEDVTFGMDDQLIGLILAVSSSAGGYSYLKEPVWWAGLISMIVGEAANFAAYAFAPAILVTPLGALSIIVSAILAHMLLNERLNMFGMMGCLLCITGSFTIVLHAPPERHLGSVVEIWQLAMQPAFLGYAVFAVTVMIFLIFVVAPLHGNTNIFVYLAICSLAGSLSVMSCKALGIAIKLTIRGDNQLVYSETHACIAVVVACVMTQMNYLNKSLDIFNTALVSPVYYVMFTTLTIFASIVMFRDIQSKVQMATETCGFITIVAGSMLLHTTKDLDMSMLDLKRLTSKEGSMNNLLSGTKRDPEADLSSSVAFAGDPELQPLTGGSSMYRVCLLSTTSRV
eukprot:gene21784-28803_t